MSNPNLTIFSQAWNETLNQFDDLKAVEVMMSSRNMGYRLSQSKLTQFKTGFLDVKGSTLQTILLALKVRHPAAFNFYIETIKRLFMEQSIDSIITIDVSYGDISRSQQAEVVCGLHDVLQDNEISLNELAEEIEIPCNRLSCVMQGAELKPEEYYRITNFLEAMEAKCQKKEKKQKKITIF